MISFSPLNYHDEYIYICYYYFLASLFFFIFLKPIFFYTLQTFPLFYFESKIID